MPRGLNKSDWDSVHETVCEFVNATLAEDDIIAESRNEALMVLFKSLKEKYGDHPSIIATEADFMDDDEQRLAIYKKALEIVKKMNYKEEVDEIIDSIGNLNYDS